MTFEVIYHNSLDEIGYRNGTVLDRRPQLITADRFELLQDPAGYFIGVEFITGEETVAVLFQMPQAIMKVNDLSALTETD